MVTAAMTDERLHKAWQAGNHHAASLLVRRYEGACHHEAARVYLQGADRDDALQEARLGVWKACLDYRPQVGEFGAFVFLCIRRQLYTAVKTAMREKHRMLTDTVRVVSNEVGVQVSAVELAPCVHSVVDLVEQRDAVRRLRLAAVTLTPLERGALGWVLDGVPYQDSKTVDNAVQRARRKLRVAA